MQFDSLLWDFIFSDLNSPQYSRRIRPVKPPVNIQAGFQFGGSNLWSRLTGCCGNLSSTSWR